MRNLPFAVCNVTSSQSKNRTLLTGNKIMAASCTVGTVPLSGRQGGGGMVVIVHFHLAHKLGMSTAIVSVLLVCLHGGLWRLRHCCMTALMTCSGSLHPTLNTTCDLAEAGRGECVLASKYQNVRNRMHAAF